MKVFNKTCCIVKPSNQAWSGKLPLSELDQTGVTTHVPTIYFYKQSPQDWLTLLQTLKTSLTSTLSHFSPLAGRLSFIDGGRLELDCNAQGAQFVEAYTDTKLEDLETLLPSPIYHQLIPSIDYQNTPFEEIPLLVAQVTRFACGGFSLGLNISHVVADGQSALHFVSEWARVCRGESLDTPPYLDRKVLRDRESPTTSKIINHEEFGPPPVLIDGENERGNETTVTMLKLTATQVETLRNKANQSQKNYTARGFTRYEAITAHIWRTSCQARNHKPEQPTGLALCVDVRTKMKPPLPQKYFGNAIVNVVATGYSGEIVSKPLGYVSGKIRDVINKVDDEYVNSVIEFFKKQEDLSLFRELIPRDGDDDIEERFFGNPNVGVISWLTLPMYGADFGWGKEVHMGPGTHESDGDSLILSGKDGDGSLVVALCLQVRHMEDFKKVFYQDIDMD